MGAKSSPLREHLRRIGEWRNGASCTNNFSDPIFQAVSGRAERNRTYVLHDHPDARA